MPGNQYTFCQITAIAKQRAHLHPGPAALGLAALHLVHVHPLTVLHGLLWSFRCMRGGVREF